MLKVFPVVLVRNAWAFLNSANLRTIVLLQLLTSSLCEQTADCRLHVFQTLLLCVLNAYYKSG